jgi:hypothetical protein
MSVEQLSRSLDKLEVVMNELTMDESTLAQMNQVVELRSGSGEPKN